MTKKTDAVCVLVSGGVDSAVLAAELLEKGREVHPLYVRCGLRWEDAEIASLRRFLGALRRRRFKGRLMPLSVAEAPVQPLIGRHWSLSGKKVPAAGSPWESVYLPGRNLLLLAEAGLFCARRGIPAVAQAVLKGNPFADASPGFRRAMERVLLSGLGARVRVEAPYAKLTKPQVLRRVDGLPLHLTFSCLRPNRGGHCGRCSKCEERFEGFEA